MSWPYWKDEMERNDPEGVVHRRELWRFQQWHWRALLCAVLLIVGFAVGAGAAARLAHDQQTSDQSRHAARDREFAVRVCDRQDGVIKVLDQIVSPRRTQQVIRALPPAIATVRLRQDRQLRRAVAAIGGSPCNR